MLPLKFCGLSVCGFGFGGWTILRAIWNAHCSDDTLMFIAVSQTAFVTLIP